MNIFYATDIRGELIFFDEEETRHAVQVLRKRSGDAVTVVDGKGGFYTGTIREAGKRSCVVQVETHLQGYGLRPFAIHLAVAPTKNLNRWEWFLEKATEIGVDEITPVWCAHSERRHLRTDRLEKVLIAAMKQSLKAYLPVLHEPVSFEELINRPAGNADRFIAYLGEEGNTSLWDNYRAGKNVTILIGPEGDFSPEEVRQALDQHFVGVNLGASRLRTETAAIVACHTIHLANDASDYR